MQIHTSRPPVFLAATAFSLLLATHLMAVDLPTKTLFDFSNDSSESQWISVNDGVMGGVSEGAFKVTDNSSLDFYGRLSLENRGGFASIRTRPANLELDGYHRLILRVKGDGRTYYLNLITSSPRTASSYRVPFDTKPGVWQEVQADFADFEYTSYGRVIPDAPALKAADIRSLGITLADKQAGPFRLEIDRIVAAQDEAVAKPKHVQPEESEKSIIDLAKASGQFTTLLTAAKAAGLAEVLSTKGPLTLFAPTDEAFKALPPGTVDSLLKPENKSRLVAVLKHHLVEELVPIKAWTVESLQGEALKIDSEGTTRVNGAKVLSANLAAANGLVHVIDRVLLPHLPEPTPAMQAMEVIEFAIDRGVPLFNQGQPEACAAIYEVAIQSLLRGYPEALNDQDRSRLQRAVDGRPTDQDATRRAWHLRHALDAVHHALQNR